MAKALAADVLLDRPRSDQEIAAVQSPKVRREIQSFLGAGLVSVKRAVLRAVAGARHRRAPGRRPVRVRGSRRGAAKSARAGPSDPDEPEPPSPPGVARAGPLSRPRETAS